MLTVDQALHASGIAKNILINTIPICIIFTLCAVKLANIYVISAITILIVGYFLIKTGIKNTATAFTISFWPLWFSTTIIFAVFSYFYYEKMMSFNIYVGIFFIAICFPAQFLFLYELRKMQHVDS